MLMVTTPADRDHPREARRRAALVDVQGAQNKAFCGRVDPQHIVKIAVVRDRCLTAHYGIRRQSFDWQGVTMVVFGAAPATWCRRL